MTGKEEAPKNDSGAILMYIRRDAPVREQVGQASLPTHKGKPDVDLL